jgi:collagenase-like PrtC family protease
MQRIELLAPARNLECGLAAINCGADALYVGAGRFSARENAGNSLGDIESLARTAHKFWARVYVALNTLLFDHEIPQAVDLAWKVYEAGADGLIIQDVGLLECDLPPLPLIASTQMHNHNSDRVAFLEKAGFQRAILARELSLEQIREIRAKTTLELEFFVHGALCVGYSGQCSMSYALGGRSGNRGQCAQPCRKAYTLMDRNGTALIQDRYLLSLKDLNLSNSLEDLLEAGITSFKIEGRLKEKAYVRNVVAHYRQRLDSILEGKNWGRSSSGRSFFDFQPALGKTFNRSFTEHFLRGRVNSPGSIHTPKMVGEPLGKISQMDECSFQLELGILLHPGDGISFFEENRGLCGTRINAVCGPQIFPDKIDKLCPGLSIFRNHDHIFLQMLERSQTKRKIPVQMIFREFNDGFELSMEDEDHVAISVSLAGSKIPAEKKDQALATLEKQLTRLGGTLFFCRDIEMELSQAYFFPISTLNVLRRQALERLEAARIGQFPRKSREAVINDSPFPEKHLTFLGNVLNRKAEAFYRRHGVEEIERAAESGLTMTGQKVMTTRYCLMQELGCCDGTSKSNVPELPLFLIDEENHRFRLKFCCDRCEMEIYLEEQTNERP